MPGKSGRKNKILFDTSYIIGYLRGNKACKSNIENVRKGKIVGFVSVIYVFELYLGVFLAAENREALKDVNKIIRLVSTANRL